MSLELRKDYFGAATETLPRRKARPSIISMSLHIKSLMFESYTPVVCYPSSCFVMDFGSHAEWKKNNGPCGNN